METSPGFNMEAAVTAILRQAAGSGISVISIENWGIGALNDCLKVETDRPKAVYFVKIEREGIVPSTRRRQIAREVSGIRLAQAAGLPTPVIVQYDLSGEQVGRKYLVEEFIDAQLFWEIQDQLSEVEREALRQDMSAVLEKMKTITSPVFGDPFPGGPVGQHLTWKAACRASTGRLLNDCQELEIFSAAEMELINQALTAQMEKLVSTLPAALYHGDLGLHNVMVDRSAGYARVGTVIDFGNTQFTPLYMNDQDTRLYGGFGLGPVDVERCYDIGPDEQSANRLISGFSQIVFRAVLKQKFNYDTGQFREEFLEECRKVER